MTKVDSSPIRRNAQAAGSDLSPTQGPLGLVRAALHSTGNSLLDSPQFVDSSLISLYITFPGGRCSVLLNKLRATLSSAFLWIGLQFSKLGLPPSAWTILSLLFAGTSSLLYGYRSYMGPFLGRLFILVAGFFDIVDGAVARSTGRTTKNGAFIDSALDRVGEVVIYLGILEGRYTSPLSAFLAVTFSLLVSYTRARADALGVDLSGVGVGERSERLLILAVLSMIGFVSYGVILVALLAILTFLDRTR